MRDPRSFIFITQKMRSLLRKGSLQPNPKFKTTQTTLNGQKKGARSPHKVTQKSLPPMQSIEVQSKELKGKRKKEKN